MAPWRRHPWDTFLDNAPLELDPAPGALRIDAAAIRSFDDRLELGDGWDSLTLRWDRVVELSAQRPWPGLSVTWQYRLQTSSRAVEPAATADRERFEQRVEALFEHAGKVIPDRVVRGWLEIPRIRWEPVDALPVEPSRREGEGIYRDDAREPPKRILARREKPTPLEAMWQWLTGRPHRALNELPREIVVTRDHLYVEQRDGNVVRVPVGGLRSCEQTAGDRLYLFGRSTRFFLPYREDCQVAATLDRLLDSTA